MTFGHPLDIRPKGNLLIDRVENSRDIGGVGYFKVLEDTHIADIIEYLDPQTLSQLMVASRTFYAFCSSDDLWLQFVLSQFNGRFEFRSSWRQTYIDCVTASRSLLTLDLNPISCLGFYSDLLFQRWYCTIAQLQPSWLSQETLERIEGSLMSPEEFRHRYIIPSKPVILTGLVNQWAAMHKWNRKYFIEISRDTIFDAGAVKTTMKNFFNYADTNQDEAPAFIFDSNFADNVEELETDYEVCEFFKDDLFTLIPNRPNHRWLLIGNKYSGSKWHVDPNRTHAWNGVVSGAKRWMFLPPGHCPPGVFPSRDGSEVIQPLSLKDWYLNFYKHARNCDAGAPLLEGTCRAGEMVFVPRDWWHAVMNLEDNTFAVTQNCITPEICGPVRWFLKYRQDQVSGVSEERKQTLWQEFDDALRCHRPDLLVPLPPPPHVELEEGESLNCESSYPRRKRMKFISSSGTTPLSETQSDESISSTPSFWDEWRASNKKIVIRSVGIASG